MDKETVIKLYNKVFPNSLMTAQKACLSDYYFFDGFLAKDKTEIPNGIRLNSCLKYQFSIDNGVYEEQDCMVMVKPSQENERYLYCEYDKLRKKTIKNVTEEKLLKRFQQVKDLVIKNKDNFKDLLFNINSKI